MRRWSHENGSALAGCSDFTQSISFSRSPANAALPGETSVARARCAVADRPRGSHGAKAPSHRDARLLVDRCHGVSNPVYAYPAQLNIGLEKALPSVNVEVLNWVIGDQDVEHMAARMRADMMPRLPSLMIWQTGTNAAMYHVPLHIFERRLRERIGIGKSLGADFVLMSLQYVPAVVALPDGGIRACYGGCR
jgi:hypothetical protein